MKKIGIAVVFLVSALLIMFLLGRLKKESPRSKRPPATRALSVRSVEYSQYVPEISQLGRIEAVQKVNLTPEASGRVLNRGFKLRKGRSFNKNQILAVIEHTQVSNNFRLSVSEVLAALGEMLPNIKLDMPEHYDKWKKFFNELDFNKLPPLPEISSDKEKMLLTRYKIFTSYYNAANQYDRLQNHYIRAPFSGEVADAAVNSGDVVSAGKSIGKFINNSSYEIELAVQNNEFHYINTGKKVRVVPTGSHKAYTGEIVRKVTNINNQTREVVVSLPPDGKKNIVDGGYAEVFIPLDSLNSVRLLRTAVYKQDNVLVVENIKERHRGKSGKSVKAGELGIKPVEVAFSDRRYAYITSGLSEGDIVIESQLEDPVKGMLVEPVVRESE